ncbi:uncharacterized protein LOC132934278 [Metopolophium dirhodum]|uniref:uncharacterized protein LOC132934278 n=1 Tax=Metopolophium dirhodum TaxID=44670 RepID=UPI0029903966|nr:uncharacterized protein LOC132934278 [Metopolophium dirhodum]
MFSNPLANAPKPTDSIDFFNVANDNEYDHESTQVPDKLNITNLHSGIMKDISSNIEHQPESEDISSNNDYRPETEDMSSKIQHQPESEYINIHLTQMVNDIGHAVMDVARKMATLQKDLKIIQVDVMKNQKLLIDINTHLTHSVTTTDQRSFNRSSLNISIETMDVLKKIDAEEDKLKTLYQILKRDSKSFDAKRTTYLAMKTVIHNKLAEYLNMEGRRGDKSAFNKFKICTIVIDSVKDHFPHSSIVEIKGHISDWLKQAPKRK